MNKNAEGRGQRQGETKRIDWLITLLPFALILLLSLLFFLLPQQSNRILTEIRGFLCSEFSVYYLVIGLGIFLLSFYIAFSPLGSIVLGAMDEKPKYSFFAWGSMMFTAGLAADILFYSFCEWLFYAEDPHVLSLGSAQDWAGTYSLFHWGPIPWGFYLVLAVAFGFMQHVRQRSRQRYSEACRPLLGKHTDGLPGRCIDLLAVFALLAGTATTFSVATPLLSEAIRALLPISLSERSLTLLILLVTCVLYSISVMRGMQGVSLLAKACTYLFYGLLLYVLFFGGECRYILETGFASLGRLVQNFFTMATYTDPQRETGFVQSWTVFYWAYWMVWCVAAPFFIGTISRGRTIRQTILGGYVFGLGSTLVSFIVLGNYAMGLQMLGKLDVLSLYHTAGNLYVTIVKILETLPLAGLVLVVLILAMIAFYATSFDSIALVAAQYSYRELRDDEEPHAFMKGFWSVLLILLPMALVFSDSSMANLQSVSIIAAFPIGIVMLLITGSFLKDARQYLNGDVHPVDTPSSGAPDSQAIANPTRYQPSCREAHGEEEDFADAKSSIRSDSSRTGSSRGTCLQQATHPEGESSDRYEVCLMQTSSLPLRHSMQNQPEEKPTEHAPGDFTDEEIDAIICQWEKNYGE